MEQIQSESEHNRKVWSKSGFQFSQVDVCDWREVFGFGQRHLVDRLMRVIPVCVCVCAEERAQRLFSLAQERDQRGEAGEETAFTRGRTGLNGGGKRMRPR